MLAYFEIGNVFSFAENYRLSLDSSWNKSVKFKENILYDYKGLDKKKRGVLNSAVIFGANASGKSNLIKAFQYFIDIVVQDDDFDSDDFEHLIKKLAFKFNDEDKNITFKIGFIDEINSEKYLIEYALELGQKEKRINFETLKYSAINNNTLGKENIIFSRKESSVNVVSEELNNIFRKIEQDNIVQRTLLSLAINNINSSYFDAEVKTHSYHVMSKLYNDLSNNIVFNSFNHSSSEIARRIIDSPELKKKLLMKLKDFDFGIKDINTIDITDQVYDRFANIMKKIPPKTRDRYLKDLIRQKEYDIVTMHSVNSQEYALNFDDESGGTKKFLKEFINIYDVIVNGKIYIADEFEHEYHVMIQDAILEMFLEDGKDTNAQFIFTTHSLRFISPKYFSKEQIYFIEKNRHTQSSELYQLSDFNDVTYNNHNWGNLYLEGRLGAVPEVFY